MRKCYACKKRIPLGCAAKPYPLDSLDKLSLALRDTRSMLYFHRGCYLKWLKMHVKRRAIYKHAILTGETVGGMY